MRSFQKTMFILAMFVLLTQTVRHVYVKHFEDRTSVMDKFNKDETDHEITSAKSLAELFAKYEPLRRQTDELDKQTVGMKYEAEREFKDKHPEYKRAGQLRSAIGDWESKDHEIHDLQVFWAAGLLLLVAGAVAYWRGAPWIGMALALPGFAEMIWWTSPSMGLSGARLEFDRLLNNKIVFSSITLGLLVAAWVAVAAQATRQAKLH